MQRVNEEEMRTAVLQAGQVGGAACAEANAMHAETRAMKLQQMEMEQRAWSACEAMAAYCTGVNQGEVAAADYVRGLWVGSERGGDSSRCPMRIWREDQLS